MILLFLYNYYETVIHINTLYSIFIYSIVFLFPAVSGWINLCMILYVFLFFLNIILIPTIFFSTVTLVYVFPFYSILSNVSIRDDCKNTTLEYGNSIWFTSTLFIFLEKNVKSIIERDKCFCKQFLWILKHIKKFNTVWKIGKNAFLKWKPIMYVQTHICIILEIKTHKSINFTILCDLTILQGQMF